ncbi:hypothetical protein ACC699_39440, partial [Rhizobium ruizarguesonis]
IDLYAALGQTGRSAAVCLDHVRQHLGIDWAPHPADEEVQREYGRIWSQLGSRAIDAKAGDSSLIVGADSTIGKLC